MRLVLHCDTIQGMTEAHAQTLEAILAAVIATMPAVQRRALLEALDARMKGLDVDDEASAAVLSRLLGLLT